MGALPANLSIGTMIRVLALLCLAIITMVATLTTATTARDLLRLSQHLPLTPRLKLTPGTDTMDTDTVLDTMVDTMVDTMATPAPKADAKADPYLLCGGYYGLGHHYYGGYPYY